MNSYYYCFNIYWSRFHFHNPQRMLGKSRARKVWDNINCVGTKKNIIEGVGRDIKLSAYEYLLFNL